MNLLKTQQTPTSNNEEMTNDEIIEAIRKGGRELQQRIWDEFFAPSLIATEPLDPDWGKPIPCSEVDDVFLKFNPRKHSILNDSKG